MGIFTQIANPQGTSTTGGIFSQIAKNQNQTPQQTIPQGSVLPDIAKNTMNDYANAVPDFLKATQSSTNKNPIIATGENALAGTASAIGTLFAPISEAVKSISGRLVQQGGNSAVQQKIVANPTVGKVLDFFNNAGGALDKWAQAHPEASQNLINAITVGGTALSGGEKGLDKPIGTLKGIVNAADSGAGKLIDTADAVKNKFTGTPETQAIKTDAFVKDLVTPTQTVGKNGTLTQNIKAGRVEEGGLLSGRTIDSTAHQVAIENAVKSVPEVTPKNTLLQNSNAIHDAIGSTAEKLKTDLATREVQPIVTEDHWNNFISKVKSDIAENPTIVGDAETTANKIINKFQSLLPKGDITANDVLEARQGLDTWMKSMKGGNVFDPKMENAVSTALRAVRQGANDLLEGTAPDVGVKGLLRKQSLLYDAIDSIAPKAAKEAGSGVGRFLQDHPIIGKVLKIGGAGVLGGEAIKHLLP